MELVTAALLGLAAMISAVTASTVVPRSQTQSQEFESGEAALNRQFQSTEAQTARVFNATEAEKQRTFESQMSNTQYQRAVNDLKAAGLNPASIGLGLNPASTPSGSSASIGSVPGGSVGRSGIAQNTNYFGNMFATAANMAMAKDKNFMNKTIAEMYANNASQMNKATNITKKAIAEMNAKNAKDISSGINATRKELANYDRIQYHMPNKDGVWTTTTHNYYKGK